VDSERKLIHLEELSATLMNTTGTIKNDFGSRHPNKTFRAHQLKKFAAKIGIQSDWYIYEIFL